MITCARIQAAVAARHRLAIEEMRSQARRREVAHPRQEAMFLCREMIRVHASTGRQRNRISFPEIGRRFGNRDHTTVLHAIRSVEKRLADPEVRRRIDRISVEVLL